MSDITQRGVEVKYFLVKHILFDVQTKKDYNKVLFAGQIYDLIKMDVICKK